MNRYLFFVLLAVFTTTFSLSVDLVLAASDNIQVNVVVTNEDDDDPPTGGCVPGGCLTTYQCNDNIDNDGDLLVDYPTDPGCDSATDNNEYNIVVVPPDPPVICVTNCDPFEEFPPTTYTGGGQLGPFQFIQLDRAIQYFSGGEVIYVDGEKNLKILLPYNRAPESLKIIGMTIFYPGQPGKVFPFVLRVDSDKTAYLAIIGHLPEGIYPFKIHLINYQDQSLKVFEGTLHVTHGKPLAPVLPISVNWSLGVGLLAGLFHLLFAASKIGSLFDLYLLAARLLGSFFSLFGIGKKKQPWGTVYDSVTKRPLDPAYVSLLMAGNEVTSAITDIDGRYSFFVEPGTYTLSVGKTHYAFPSKKLSGKTADELYDHLYFGEPIKVESGQLINRNIPMDPIGFDWNEFAKTKKNFFQIHSRRLLIAENLLDAIFTFGLLLAVAEMVLWPSLLNLGILGLYFILLFAQMFTRFSHKAVMLKNNRTGEPMSFAIVKIYLPDRSGAGLPGSEQLIKKVVADELGRFYVLVPPGDYYLTVEEKLADQTYALVYKSETMTLKKGVLTKDIVIA